MSPEQSADSKFEIGHVLFLDIVGYSKLLIEEQKERLADLTRIVLGTAQVRESTDEQLVRIPTGDGMALVFRHKAEEPARCALEIAAALRKHPELPVRMGIHSGPVSEMTDLTGRTNIAGAGINIAQRVMDCGDAGHILVSERVAGDLSQYREWSGSLHDLGDCEVKHEVRLHLFSLHTGEAGNPAVPTRLRKRQKNKPVPAARRRRISQAPSRWPPWMVAAMLAASAVALLVWWLTRTANPRETLPNKQADSPPTPPTFHISEKSIAVLPFENLSSDKENGYFAEGVQDEILTKLASIADLKVISRTSTIKYQSKPEDLKIVSQQLGVAKVLEGTVQKATDKVRVNVQLIDARTDSHLWARSFDGDAKDIFAMESKVAQEVADSLQAKLSPSEVNQLAAAPTKDPAAYDLLLKGDYEQRLASSSLKPESFDQAETWYKQAIARDPSFALAMARLVECQMVRHWFMDSYTESELAEIRKVAEHALTLEPNLAEAHVALGVYYYYGHRDYDPALVEFGRAVQLQPNNADALAYLGYVHRRQGQLERALEEIGKALEQDPRNASLAGNRADIYCQTREWNKAEPGLRAALALDPHDVFGMRGLLLSLVNGSGDVQAALNLLASFPSDSKLVVNSTAGEITGITGERAYLFVLARDYQAALKVWDDAPITAVDQRRQLSARIAIRVIAADFDDAQADAAQVRPLLEQRLREHPSDILANTELCWVTLAQNRKQEAMKLAQQAAASMPPEKDLAVGNHLLVGEAMIASETGAPSKAVEILRRLLSVPAGHAASIARLKIDPVWDPIRNNQEFQNLLTMKERVGP